MLTDISIELTVKIVKNRAATAIHKPTLFCFVLVCKLILANFPNIFRPNLEPITKTYILTLLLRKQQTTITVAFSVDI